MVEFLFMSFDKEFLENLDIVLISIYFSKTGKSDIISFVGVLF
ncbi:hypothetical protein HMPREF9269_0143 [Ligilactobacillus salivarius ACS-116-V-Col5a]|nr:hypothetical protein HMPREF9269_0143 [Ligilactobacillus salivarius ACS-116-V-Col5a]